MRAMQDSIHLWDVAGIDGLQVMKTLFGPQVDRIAPFQSLDATLNQTPCSLLRLCEGNFRIRFSADTTPSQLSLEAATQGYRVWIKQFAWLGSLLLPPGIAPATLAPMAIAKPPFQLKSLAPYCAAPARIDGISVLVWRHPIEGRDRLELHLAHRDLWVVRSRLTAAFPRYWSESNDTLEKV